MTMQLVKKKESFEAMAFSSAVGASLGDILTLTAQPEPGVPPEGKSYIWLSNGIGIGESGDIMVKTTINSISYAGRMFAFKEQSLWNIEDEWNQEGSWNE